MKKIKVAVDVGNSNVVIGLYFDGIWEKIYRLSTKRNFTYWTFQKKLKKIIDLNDFNPSNINFVCFICYCISNLFNCGNMEKCRIL